MFSAQSSMFAPMKMYARSDCPPISFTAAAAAILIGCGSFTLSAGPQNKDFKQALKLYDNGMYERARTIFEDISKYANVIEQRLEDEVDLERLINCSKEFKEDCIANGTPFVEIDGEYNLDKILEAFC